MEYYRVLDLVDNGKTVKEAKKQAQKEIFAVFGIDSDSFKDSEDMSIFGTSESDAALLAISILLLGDLSEAEFTQRLMDFSQAIKNSGTWDNAAEKTKMADWAAGVNLISIKNNILAWGLTSEVPIINKHINDYWTMITGLGECNGKMYDLATKNCIDNKLSCKGDLYNSETKGCFVDERDGQAYGYVRINNQVWMAENLNYETVGGKCYGEDTELFVRKSPISSSGTLITLSNVEIQANCNVYGRLYSWNALMNGSASSSANPSGVRGICPDGWHVPSDDEWYALEKYADPSLTSYQANENIAGTKLKAKKGWVNSGNGTDDYGFAALPVDRFFPSELGYWWSATESNSTSAYYRDMNYAYNNVYRAENGGKTGLMSARCVRD